MSDEDLLRLFTTPETAEILKLSPATLEIWRSEGGHDLPYVKLAGGAIRYTWGAIKDFIDRSTVLPKGKELKSPTGRVISKKQDKRGKNK